MRLNLTLIFTSIALAAPAAADARVNDTRLTSFKGSGPLIGIADNGAGTLGDPRFFESAIKRVRLTVGYDQVSRGGVRRKALDQYLRGARATGVEPLVSFYRTLSCSEACAMRRLPTVSAFRTQFRRFRARYPWVRHFSTWNEMNFAAAQPTGLNPRRTAMFYRMLRSECRGRCTVLTGDYRVSSTPESRAWLRTFKRHIGPGSHIWGLVTHPDVNEFTTRRTREFLRSTRGPVWATEAGALNFYRGFFRPSLSRQASAMKYMMHRFPRVSRRLKRMYVYNWRAARGNRQFDSAMLDARGRRRPAWRVFFRAIGVRAP